MLELSLGLSQTGSSRRIHYHMVLAGIRVLEPEVAIVAGDSSSYSLSAPEKKHLCPLYRCRHLSCGDATVRDFGQHHSANIRITRG